jgi:hypothetical protein
MKNKISLQQKTNKPFVFVELSWETVTSLLRSRSIVIIGADKVSENEKIAGGVPGNVSIKIVD